MLSAKDIGGLMAMMPAFATDNAADIRATSTVDVAKLHKGKTKYQDMEIVESEEFGNVLLLDGVTQVTSRNEFLYLPDDPLAALQFDGVRSRFLEEPGGGGKCIRR